MTMKHLVYIIMFGAAILLFISGSISQKDNYIKHSNYMIMSISTLIIAQIIAIVLDFKPIFLLTLAAQLGLLYITIKDKKRTKENDKKHKEIIEDLRKKNFI